MSYRKKTIKSMAFFLNRRWDAIGKQDAIKELGKIWGEVDIKDRIAAYNIAYPE